MKYMPKTIAVLIMGAYKILFPLGASLNVKINTQLKATITISASNTIQRGAGVAANSLMNDSRESRSSNLRLIIL